MKTERQTSYTRPFLGFLVAITLLRGWFAAIVELSPDEAYYWTWSTSLAWGYYDHGPLVAWLIRLGTALFGDSELGVRFGSLLCSCLTSWMVFVLARNLTSNERHSFWIAVLMSISPLLSVGAVVHTPDAALVAAWSLAAWFGLLVFRTDKMTAWIGMGACVGLAILSKMTGLLFFAGMGLFLITCKAGRTRLRSPGLAVALATATCVALPSLVWNAVHQGGAFAFQFKHATAGLSLSFSGLIEFLGGQAGVVSPLLWLGLVVCLLTGWRRAIRFGRPEAYMFWCLSAPLLLGFALLALFHKVEANWPATVYITALPLAAWAWTGGLFYSRRMKTLVAISGSIGLIFTLVIHIQTLAPFLPIQAEKDPTARLRGWKDLAQLADQEARALDVVLASEGYGPVSQLRFYTGRPVHYERSATRRSQYDLWDIKEPSGGVLFLLPRTSGALPDICARAKERWLLTKDAKSANSNRTSDYLWWVCTDIEPAYEDNDG